MHDRWCVEFGAADGRYASNTFALIDGSGYSAVLIESDRGLFERLRARHSEAGPRVQTLCRVVGFEGVDRLDAILAQTAIPPDFDLLSIDIDGIEFGQP